MTMQDYQWERMKAKRENNVRYWQAFQKYVGLFILVNMIMFGISAITWIIK